MRALGCLLAIPLAPFELQPPRPTPILVDQSNPSQSENHTKPTRLQDGHYIVELAAGAFGQTPRSENTMVFLSTTLTVGRSSLPVLTDLVPLARFEYSVSGITQTNRHTGDAAPAPTRPQPHPHPHPCAPQIRAHPRPGPHTHELRWNAQIGAVSACRCRGGAGQQAAQHAKASGQRPDSCRLTAFLVQSNFLHAGGVPVQHVYLFQETVCNAEPPYQEVG